MNFDLILNYFQTEVWVWPTIAILFLGCFWIYHRRVVGVMNTRRRQLLENEENLKRALEEAESANRAKGAFLSSVSHEIRTPLNAIIGFSAIMAKQALTIEQYQSYGELVNVAGKSLSSLVNDILDLSALESLSFTLAPSRLKIHQLMTEIASIFKLIVEDKGIALIIKQPGNIPDLNIDGKRLRQILINIIGNAVKFTEKGRVEITVGVGEPCAGKHECDVIFTIQDTGIGIQRKDHSRIFREFEQESGLTHRKFGGSGLGLSIVSQLLELMGGTIQLESEVGVGSTFTLTFLHVPILAAEEREGVWATDPDNDGFNRKDFQAEAAALSTKDFGLLSVNREILNISEPAVDAIKAAFGERFTKLGRGVNVELINPIEADLRVWAAERGDSELIELAAIFSRATATMKIAELLKFAKIFRVG